MMLSNQISCARVNWHLHYYRRRVESSGIKLCPSGFTQHACERKRAAVSALPRSAIFTTIPSHPTRALAYPHHNTHHHRAISIHACPRSGCCWALLLFRTVLLLPERIECLPVSRLDPLAEGLLQREVELLRAGKPALKGT